MATGFVFVSGKASAEAMIEGLHNKVMLLLLLLLLLLMMMVMMMMMMTMTMMMTMVKRQGWRKKGGADSSMRLVH